MRCYLKTPAHRGLSLAIAALVAGSWVSQASAQQDQGERQDQDDQNNAAQDEPSDIPGQRQDRQDDQQPPPPARSFSDRAVDDAPMGDRRDDFGRGIRGEHDRWEGDDFGRWNSGRVYRGYRGGFAQGGYVQSGHFNGGYGSCGSHGGSYHNYQRSNQAPPMPPDDAAASGRYWNGSGQGRYAQQQNAQQQIDPQRPVLGIRVRNDDGTRVTMVRPDSPAQEAGLQEGDLIVSVNGNQVQGTDGLIEMIRRTDRDEDVELMVTRNGEEMELTSQLTTYREAFGDQSARGQGGIAQSDIPPAPPASTARNPAEESLRRFGEGEGQRRSVARVPFDDQRSMEEMQREIDRLKQENEDLRQQLRDKTGESQVDSAPLPDTPQPAAEETADELNTEPPAEPDAEDGSTEEVEPADDTADPEQGDEDQAEAADPPDAIREKNVDEPKDDAGDDNKGEDENEDADADNQ